VSTEVGAPAEPRCTCTGMFHELSCSLATDCGGWTWDPPYGGCDRCLCDMTAYCLSLDAIPLPPEPSDDEPYRPTTVVQDREGRL
jgi:hypothetical protein